MALSCELSIRSALETVAAVSPAPGPGPYMRLLSADSGAAAYRVLNFASIEGSPFNARINWGVGQGFGPTVEVSYANGGVICVYARTLNIDVANFDGSDNRISVAVGDGFMPCANDFYQVEVGHATNAQSFQVPAFAQWMRIDIDDNTLYAAARADFIDGLGTTRAQLFLSQQGERGFKVAGIDRVDVRIFSAADYQVVWGLSL